jgi:hypothetical protein
MTITQAQAAEIILARRDARRSLLSYATRVPVPGSSITDYDDEARIPLIESSQSAHHKMILDYMQWSMQTPHARLMILAPPGSAKSTYASVVAPAWYLGQQPNRRVILAHVVMGDVQDSWLVVLRAVQYCNASLSKIRGRLMNLH